MVLCALLAYELPNSAPDVRVQFRWQLQSLGWTALGASFTLARAYALDDAERTRLIESDPVLRVCKNEPFFDPEHWFGLAADRKDVEAAVRRDFEGTARQHTIWNWNYVLQVGSEAPFQLRSADVSSP